MRNLTLLTDLYQLTMMNGYYEKNIHEDIVVFDMFFRKNAVMVVTLLFVVLSN